METHLSERELDFLDNFLLDRLQDKDVKPETDEGILGVSELDGYLTAITSSPNLIPPSIWIESIWGDYEQVWDSPEDFKIVFDTLLKLSNDIICRIMEYPEEYEPLFLENRVGSKTYVIVDDWCEGYMRGVDLWEQCLWSDKHQNSEEHLLKLIGIIASFSDRSNWSAHNLEEPLLIEAQNSIKDCAIGIHKIFLLRRKMELDARILPAVATQKIGRNAPCPCGSGKKFKKCCLH